MSTLKVDAIRHNSATSDAITTASDGTCTAKLTSVGGGQLSHRNLIINGDFRINQRGSSSTASGRQTVDRFSLDHSGTDEGPTQAQVDVAAGTTPYELGFRKAFKVTNGNQTGGAGAGDFIRMLYLIEAQDIANSGWNYKSSSSYITLSFWVKTSVAQTYYFNFRAYDGTQKMYCFSVALSANTWTKVTKTIPGHADLSFDNDTGTGMYIQWYQFRGTNNTGTVTLNQWNNYDSSILTPDQTSTWYTTNDATFEITGVQLEVGDTATSFEHRSYGEELSRCQRYYQRQAANSDAYIQPGKGQGTTSIDAGYSLAVPLRAEPTVACASNRVFKHNGYSNSTTAPTVIQWNTTNSPYSSVIALNFGGHSSITSNYVCSWCPTFGSVLTLDAEL